VAAGIAAGIVLASLALPVVIFERAGKKKITSAQAAHALEQTKPKEAPATADQVEQAVQGPNRRAHVGTSPKKNGGGSGAAQSPYRHYQQDGSAG